MVDGREEKAGAASFLPLLLPPFTTLGSQDLE